MQIGFITRVAVYMVCFALSFFGLSAVHYERFLKPNHVPQAQVLYWLLVMALAYLAGSFILAFIYTV